MATQMNDATRMHVIASQHLDVAWLWTRVPEGEDLMRQCFERAADMIEADPTGRFVFSRSTAWSFWIVQQRYPQLFERVRRHVASGRLELCGGEWVEPDHLIPDGESLVRQMALGQWYFQATFGQTAACAGTRTSSATRTRCLRSSARPGWAATTSIAAAHAMPRGTRCTNSSGKDWMAARSPASRGSGSASPTPPACARPQRRPPAPGCRRPTWSAVSTPTGGSPWIPRGWPCRTNGRPIPSSLTVAGARPAMCWPTCGRMRTGSPSCAASWASLTPVPTRPTGTTSGGSAGWNPASCRPSSSLPGPTSTASPIRPNN